jgi:hypothetical protein
MGDYLVRAKELERFEAEAEVLVAYQLDFLAQLERQLRAVHKTMRDIEKLRSSRNRRVGPELTNGEREDTLVHLSNALSDVEDHIGSEHDCCADMQTTIAHMRERLARMRRLVPGSVSDRSDQRDTGST